MARCNPRFPRTLCERTGRYYTDLTGQIFGSWTVLRPVAPGAPKWVCRCVCGTERWVFNFSLISGQSLSCGCRPRAPRLKLEEPRITAIIHKGSKYYAVLPTDASTVPRAMFQALAEARAYRDAQMPPDAVDALLAEAAADDSPMLRMSDPGAMAQLREALGLPSSVTTDDAPRHTDTPMISSDSHAGPQTA